MSLGKPVKQQDRRSAPAFDRQIRRLANLTSALNEAWNLHATTIARREAPWRPREELVSQGGGPSVARPGAAAHDFAWRG
jgi:hypothetical protein